MPLRLLGSLRGVKMLLNPWKGWNKKKESRLFVEGFFDVVSDEVTPPSGIVTPSGGTRGRGREMRSPLGKRIAESAFQLWHFYKNEYPEFLIEKLHLDVYPYASGEAVGFIFVGKDCTWVTNNLETDVDEQVLDGEAPVMTEKTLAELEQYLADLTWDYDSLLRDEIEEMSDEEKARMFYRIVDQFAVPLSSIGVGQEFIFASPHSIEFSVRRGPTSGIPRIKAQVKREYRRVYPKKKSKKKGKKAVGRILGRRPQRQLKRDLVFEQYEWDEVPIHYYAWDVGLMDAPYGELVGDDDLY